MASDRNRRHILINGEPSIERYTPHRQRITPAKPPAPQSRVAHGNALKQELKVAADEAKKRRHDGKELERLMEFAGLQDLQVSQRRLQFDDRIVVLVRATPAALSASIGVLNDLAEVQRAKETAAVFADMGPDEQTDWVKDLDARTTDLMMRRQRCAFWTPALTVGTP